MVILDDAESNAVFRFKIRPSRKLQRWFLEVRYNFSCQFSANSFKGRLNEIALLVIQRAGTKTENEGKFLSVIQQVIQQVIRVAITTTV